MALVLDRAAFGRLFVEHARVLWVVAAAFVPKAAVEDVVQEAAAVALTRLHEFRPGSSFRAWMAQIVRFVAANAQRRSRRDAKVATMDEDVIDGHAHDDGTAMLDRKGLLRGEQTGFDDHVVHALGELAPEVRASLLLRVVMDMSYADIATTLALPEGTVASHVHRARQVMRARLGAALHASPAGERP
jgi:RNA polymerase sigma-70 factor (ECF subfamily)